MTRIPVKIYPFGSLFLSLLIALGCASEGNLTGGEKDGEGPKVIRTIPETGTLNYLGKEITIFFDEYIRSGSYASEIFISPVQDEMPEITTGLKKIKIRLKDQLRPSTTYVITLSTGIKDANEGNSMAKPLTIAFSTGAQLDSMTVKGKVIDPATGSGEEEYTVLLFPQSEQPNDSIMGKAPLYASITDKEGKFKLNYLARQDYRIYAVKDLDRNFKYNMASEKLGLAGDPLIVFPDSVDQARITLQSTKPDLEPPLPRSAKWINDRTILVDFKEEIPFTLGRDTLKIFMTDTSGNFPEMVYEFKKVVTDKSKLFLLSPRAKSAWTNIHFRYLMDSLGNRRDTFISINENKFDKDYQDIIILEPVFDEQQQRFSFAFTYPLRSYLAGRLIEITDTISGETFNYTNRNQTYQMDISLEKYPEKKARLKIDFLKGIEFRAGEAIDTTITHYYKLKSPEDYGGLSGTVNDEEVPGNWKVFLKNEKGEIVRKIYAKEFDFKRLKAGKYTFWMFNDADSNNVYTPGSLFPYRLPEKVYVDSNPVEVRGKWEVENHEVVVQKSFKAVKGSGIKNSKKGGRGDAPKTER